MSDGELRRLENCLNQGKIDEALQSIRFFQNHRINLSFSIRPISPSRRPPYRVAPPTKVEIIKELVEEYGIDEATASRAAARATSVESALAIILNQ